MQGKQPRQTAEHNSTSAVQGQFDRNDRLQICCIFSQHTFRLNSAATLAFFPTYLALWNVLEQGKPEYNE